MSDSLKKGGPTTFLTRGDGGIQKDEILNKRKGRSTDSYHDSKRTGSGIEKQDVKMVH